MKWGFRGLAAALIVGLLSACATTSGADSKTTVQRADPWEGWNRKVYAFNDKLDEAILKPVATTYTKVVPQPVRRGVSNVIGNVSDMWSAINNFLQGKVANGFQDVARVGTNTVFGLLGIFDVASEFGIDRQGEDFGQTLGRWGMGPGPYVVWPLLGPSTARDSLALPLDRSVSPALFVDNEPARWGILTLQFIDERAGLLSASNMLNDIALDRYAFVRDAYLQRRRSLVYDGDAPDTSDKEDDPADKPAAAEPAASVPAK